MIRRTTLYLALPYGVPPSVRGVISSIEEFELDLQRSSKFGQFWKGGGSGDQLAGKRLGLLALFK